MLFSPPPTVSHKVTSVIFLQGTADLEREDEEEMEDSGEVLDDSSSSPSSTLKNYPLTCKVLYSYKVPAEYRLFHMCNCGLQ